MELEDQARQLRLEKEREAYVRKVREHDEMQSKVIREHISEFKSLFYEVIEDEDV